MTLRYQNILITRTDRIGDVILSLPVAAAIKDAWPDARVTFMVQEFVKPVVDMCPWVDASITTSEDLPGQDFDAAVCLYPRREIARVLQRAQIPIRVGTSRRLYSYRFNRRVNVSRAHGGKHERDFNLDLLRGLGIASPKVVDPICQPNPETVAQAGEMLNDQGVDAASGSPVVLIHPGCGGSARNWARENYRLLCEQLAARSVQVVLSGTESERALTDYVAGEQQDRVTNIAGTTDLPTLAGVMRHADLFIGPSTGPMHLAAAVGLPALALFGPVRTTTPDRWGPLGNRHHVFTPDVPTCNCKLDQCKLGDCMQQIAVQTVADKAMDMCRSNDNPASLASSERRNIQAES